MQRGLTLYLALAEKRSEVNRQLRAFGMGASDLLGLIFPPLPAQPLAWFVKVTRELRPAPIVVDTMQRLLRVPDLNDYAVGVERARARRSF